MNIREAQVKDASALLALFVKLDVETDFMLFEPGERETTIEAQGNIIADFKQQTSKTMIIAESLAAEKATAGEYETESNIVGFCGLVAGIPARISHVATLVIGIEKQVWGKGIGTKLMQQALLYASDMGISRIELTVSTSNVSAINLYKKFGFSIEGEKIAAINLAGNLTNEYAMARVLGK